MRHLLIIIALFATSFLANGQGIDGPWKGDLRIGMTKLAIVFHFQDGKCSMDSPDQGALGLPAEVEYMSADSVCVTQKTAAIMFSGRLRDGAIVGRFSQGGLTVPLVLTPGDIERSRPQTPVGPFPYRTEEVSFNNGDVTLAGTLTYPEGWNGRKKVPVAIMVSGSGTQNRDEEIYGHKPFLVIADHLARNGIATLRYDDRGAGSSTGDAASATTYDFMLDAEAGIDLLRSLKKFKKVGIIGHSEGGEIAFMLGARNKVDYIVSLAGPGVQGDSILLFQNLNALKLAGYPDMKITKEYVRAQIKAQKNPWLDYFIDYDPVQDIRLIRCPALFLNGDLDTQVEAEVNIHSIYENLPKNRGGKGFANKHTGVTVYPSLNHLFQHCQTGQADEYPEIEETISPEVLEDIARWIGNL
ncbi:MAG: alpha/beta fold hydrolase [Bacteroidales bacterium]|nr:alpha/beta fold hydrolase [Bacteroidales bacterium]